MPLLEAHDPTDKELDTRIFSPPHAAQFGGLQASTKLPACHSAFFSIGG